MKITNNIMHRIYKICEYFGADAQREKAVEELNELVVAIDNNDRDNVVEEIADVTIMIEQVKKIYHITDMEVMKVIEYKVNRTEKRIMKNDK